MIFLKYFGEIETGLRDFEKSKNKQFPMALSHLARGGKWLCTDDRRDFEDILKVLISFQKVPKNICFGYCFVQALLSTQCYYQHLSEQNNNQNNYFLALFEMK